MENQKRKRRSVPITLGKGFEKEYEYIQALKEDGIRISHWVGMAIREKMSGENRRDDLIKQLLEKVALLEREVNAKPKVVYIKSKESTEEKLAAKTKEKLAKSVSVFDF